jgi:hypothetical protein
MPSPWNPTQGSEFRLIVALDSEVNTEEVLPGSPQWKHDLVYERAVRFRREFCYDFVQ